MWKQAYMSWVRAKRVPEAGAPAVSRKTWHPQPDWERNLKLSGTHDAWGMGQTDLMPRLRQQDSFFIPSGGKTAIHILLHGAVSDSRSRHGWACGKSLQSLQEAGVGKDRKQDENCNEDRLHWKDEKKCSGIIQNWIIMQRCNLQSISSV